MKCPVCGKEQDENNTICTSCGYDLEKYKHIQELNEESKQIALSVIELKKVIYEENRELHNAYTQILDMQKIIAAKKENQLIEIDQEINKLEKELDLYKQENSKQKQYITKLEQQIQIQINHKFIFGSYKQGKNEKEPIEWIVLTQQENKALLISKDILDTRPFNKQSNNISWQECDLNKWLNKEFYNEVFNEEEKKKILINDKGKGLFKPKNKSHNHVFLLSIEEAKKYFTDDKDRAAKGTNYARGNGLWVDANNGNSYWWLRSPGDYSSNAAYIRSDGSIYSIGNIVYDTYTGVRPACWINLKGE